MNRLCLAFLFKIVLKSNFIKLSKLLLGGWGTTMMKLQTILEGQSSQKNHLTKAVGIII